MRMRTWRSGERQPCGRGSRSYRRRSTRCRRGRRAYRVAHETNRACGARGVMLGYRRSIHAGVLHSKEIGPFAAVAVRSTVALPVIWLAYYVAMNVVKSPMEVQGWQRLDGDLVQARDRLGACSRRGDDLLLRRFEHGRGVTDQASRVRPRPSDRGGPWLAHAG